MKRFRPSILLSAILALSLTACDEETADLLSIKSDGTKTLVSLPGVARTASYRFTTNGSWRVSCSDPSITITPQQGSSDGKSIDSVVVSTEQYNLSNDAIESTFTIDVTNARYSIKQNVTVSRQPVFKVEETAYTARADGDTIKVRFQTDADLTAGVYIHYDPAFSLMLAQQAPASFDRVERTLKLPITPNPSTTDRKGSFRLAIDKPGRLSSVDMTVTQQASGVGVSTDTISANGKVTLLQKHTEGRGVPVILMGDGFIDKEIENGIYREAMLQACEHLFDVEPMTSLREYFDVYEVTAVSLNNRFAPSSSTPSVSAYSTAFSSVFGEGTLITGDDDKAVDYARKAVDNVNDALIVIVLNDTRYAGTCSLYSDGKKSDIPSGYSIAYVPMTAPDKYDGVGFADVIHHEAVGHGFAKLADEYSEHGVITSVAMAELKAFQSYGFSHNVTLSPDVAESYWADFAADSRYASEALSCYEGAYTFLKGVYRPTENSIMNQNTGTYNAPSRLMIYKRCMRIAFGSAWSYDHEAFITFDAPSRVAVAKARKASQPHAPAPALPRLAAPRLRFVRK